MKKIGMLAAAFMAVSMAGTAAAQGGVQGDWWTEGQRAKVRISPCANQAGQLCGRFVNPKTGALAKGPPFLTGFKAAGRNRWSGGKIRNPEDGKTYSSKMSINPNGTLSVSGCVLAVFCKAQTWTRVTS